MTLKAKEPASGQADAIIELYTRLAQQPEQDFGWNKGKENARTLGYNEGWLERLPDIVWESAAGVGNPFSLGALGSGDVVVDIGCGCGADVCIAAFLVGDKGRAIGIDITPAMITKARAASQVAGITNASFLSRDSEGRQR